MWMDGESPEKGSGTGDQPAGSDKPVKGGEKEITLTRKEYESQQKRMGELEAESRFWQQRAAPAAAAEPEPEDEEDIFADIPEFSADDPEAFTDKLTTHGAAALRDAGLMTKAQVKSVLARQEAKLMKTVEGIVGKRMAAAQKSMVSDAEMINEFPGLKDADSDFTKLTAKHYRSIISEDPALKNSPTTLKIAARLAKAESTPSREDERIRRIKAQEGGGNFSNEGDGRESLSDMQRTIIGKFNDEGGTQISEDSYRKRASAGVNVSYRAGSMDWSKQ